MNISSRKIGGNIEKEASENDCEYNQNGRLPDKSLAFSVRIPSTPSGVTVLVIHYLVLTVLSIAELRQEQGFPCRNKYKIKE